MPACACYAYLAIFRTHDRICGQGYDSTAYIEYELDDVVRCGASRNAAYKPTARQARKSGSEREDTCLSEVGWRNEGVDEVHRDLQMGVSPTLACDEQTGGESGDRSMQQEHGTWTREHEHALHQQHHKVISLIPSHLIPHAVHILVGHPHTWHRHGMPSHACVSM